MPRNVPRCCFSLLPIEYTFAELASKTWDDLRDSINLEATLGEESITDYLLLTLKRKHKSEIIIKQFHHSAESICGADWEWWFTENGSWIGMRIQAKKINSERRYRELDYTDNQIRHLIDTAAERNLYPMYCFYNYWKGTPQPTVSHAYQHLSSRLYCSVVSRKFWGCSLASALHIQHIRSNNLAEILKVSFPWMCLFCQIFRENYAHDEPIPILPELVAKSINNYQKTLPENNDFKKIVPKVRNERPKYILKDNGNYFIDEHNFRGNDKTLQGIVIIDNNY